MRPRLGHSSDTREDRVHLPVDGRTGAVPVDAVRSVDARWRQIAVGGRWTTQSAATPAIQFGTVAAHRSRKASYDAICRHPHEALRHE
ncbi:hypothetical protein C7S10_12850 [Nocardioides currus]|uniref:Uncharacterized protein n=1 Tax=Nocardioides currus TaxID=2133958 RepID=A0A2R7YW86_9ACTN|nr:hypothetical protein C7S10_12850 [Nocardioides currus]